MPITDDPEPAPADVQLPPPDPKPGHDAARFIATTSLSIGALMLVLFGIIERMVTFEKLAVAGELKLLALCPGIATLALLACARAISWMISNMTFTLWRGVVPQHQWEAMQRSIELSNQFHYRITLMSGAYLLFTLVITSLAAASAGLTFGLSAPELGMPILPTALTVGLATAALVLYDMLTRNSAVKNVITGIYVALVIVVMILDVVIDLRVHHLGR